MSGANMNEDLRGLAALYLLGLLSPEEGAMFTPAPASEAHRAALTDMGEVVASIGMAAPPAAPPPELKDRLKARLERNPYSGLFSKRSHEQGPWKPLGSPGVFYKKLLFDPSTGLVTLLVKMEPGARFGAHTHGRTEQCLILEGDLRYSEEKIYRAGDFTWAEAGSVDPALYTVEGNLLLIVTEP
jgi:anti-sigma factor ChrR (cupin superfamily)